MCNEWVKKWIILEIFVHPQAVPCLAHQYGLQARTGFLDWKWRFFNLSRLCASQGKLIAAINYLKKRSRLYSWKYCGYIHIYIRSSCIILHIRFSVAYSRLFCPTSRTAQLHYLSGSSLFLSFVGMTSLLVFFLRYVTTLLRSCCSSIRFSLSACSSQINAQSRYSVLQFGWKRFFIIGPLTVR